MNAEEIISDLRLDLVFDHATYDITDNKRKIIDNQLLKLICGFNLEDKALVRLRKLDLVNEKYEITTLGRMYIYYRFKK